MTQDPAALIIYHDLDHPCWQSCWKTGKTVLESQMLAKIARWGGHPWFFAHRGYDDGLFRGAVTLEHLGIASPAYDPDFPMSWGEITDVKAIEVLDLARRQNKQILISWSGGIDSSVVLVALLKWARNEDLERLIVATKKSAVWENGMLFDLIVDRKLKLIDYDRMIMSIQSLPMSDYILLNGHPADQLLIGMNDSTRLVLENKEYAQIPWKQTSHLKKYLSTFIDDDKVVEWLIAKVACNLESIDNPVESCYSFIWWISFNYFFSAVATYEFVQTYSRWAGLPFETWRHNRFAWFEDMAYQKWAMANCNRFDVLFGPNFNQWKWCAKQYMFDYTKDYYYLNYKTKVASIGRKSSTREANPGWTCMDKDNNFYSRHENAEQTRSLIASSINPRFATNV